MRWGAKGRQAMVVSLSVHACSPVADLDSKLEASIAQAKKEEAAKLSVVQKSIQQKTAAKNDLESTLKQMKVLHPLCDKRQRRRL